MESVLKVISRLTKNFEFASAFLNMGGLDSILDFGTSVSFTTISTLVNIIIRHMLEDPATLQTSMEAEIVQIMTLLSGRSSTLSNTGFSMQPRQFLNTFAALASRDPEIFLDAAAAACRLTEQSNICLSATARSRATQGNQATGGPQQASTSISTSTTTQQSTTSSSSGLASPPTKRRISHNSKQVSNTLISVLVERHRQNDLEEVATKKKLVNTIEILQLLADYSNSYGSFNSLILRHQFNGKVTDLRSYVIDS